MTDTERNAVYAYKFADPSKSVLTVAARKNEPAATVRYYDERDVTTGDRIDLRTVDNDSFGVGEVFDVEVCTVGTAYEKITKRCVHHPSVSYVSLRDALNEYYDDDISLSTRVKVIFFDPELYSDQA